MKQLLIFSSIIIVVFICSYCQGDTNFSAPNTPFLNVADTVAYVGMQTCRSCHNDVYQSYIHTGMGQSFHQATPQKSKASYGDHALVYDEKSNFYYKPFFKDSTLYVKEFRLEGADTVYQRTETISYIVGSGQHTNSHILDFNGYIFQAPITYYTQEEKWDMAPGFDRDNLRFSRLLTTECITCHNHFPKHEARSMNKFEEIPQGIECERCHGAGALHVKEKLAGKLVDTSQYIDYTIVNPRHLERDLQMDLCQRCHLQGVSVLNEGKDFFDFRPGMKLSDVFNVFLPQYSDTHEKFIMASQADRLRQSPCYIQSESMTCITCHNPHKSVEVTDNKQYNQACQNCHQTKKCSAPQLERSAQNDNCVHCHMPRSGSIDIPHVNITDHRISKATALKSKTIAKDKAAAIASFLGLKILTKDKATPLEMAQGYVALYEKYVESTVMLDSALYYLNRSELSPEAQFKTRIHYNFARENYDELIKLAQQTDPNSLNDAWTAYRIGEALFKRRKYHQALLFYKKATALLPYHLDFQEKLGVTYLRLEYVDDAERILKFVLSENPNRKVALTNLGYLTTLRKDIEGGMKYYNKALALDPDYEQAIVNKIAILLIQKKKAVAKKYLDRLLVINPKNVHAKNIARQLK